MDSSQTPNQENNENISTTIAKEEHFISADEANKHLNAIYIEDNPQLALEKLVNLSHNENFQERLQYIKHLPELLDTIGEEVLTNLDKIISFIPQDKVDMKREFLDQVTPILIVLKNEGKQGYKELVNVVLPIVCSLLHAVHYDVKEKSAEQLAEIGAILTKEDREKYLLPQVLTIAHDSKKEENRMIAARILNQLAPLFGKDLCEQFIGAELLAMMEDDDFGVRKEAIFYLPCTAKVVSTRFFGQKLLPAYFRLCKDPNWEVRLACIQTIYDISSLCVDEFTQIREKELTSTTVSYLKDSSSMVKIATYKALGPFISTLRDLKVHEKLIDHYLRMVEKSVNNLEPNDEILHACAYNFPAVALTLGPAKWPVLKKLFRKLVQGEPKIRKPLACSLHVIADILGEARTEKYLLPVLTNFLKDPSDEVKYGAVQNLGLFFKVFSENKRDNLIDLLIDLLKDQIKWRIRELIAKQIGKFTLIFSSETTFRIIAPITFKLCNDPVAHVREEAVRNIYALFKAVSKTEKMYMASIIENIKGFSQSNRYSTRQSFVSMCGEFTQEPELFKEHFMNSFLPLAADKVSNVRLSVAKTLQKMFEEGNQLSSDLRIMTMVKKLKRDPSADIRTLMQSVMVSGGYQISRPELEIESTTQLDERQIEEAKYRGKGSPSPSRLAKAKMLIQMNKNK